MRFSPDGHWLATTSDASAALIWNVHSGQVGARLGHEFPVATVAFSSDSRWLATGSWDGTARVWDVALGREASRTVHEHVVSDVAFGPKGRLLVASWDRAAWALPWRAEALVGSACAHLTRNFTEAEWAHYLPDIPCRASCPGLPLTCQPKRKAHVFSRLWPGK